MRRAQNILRTFLMVVFFPTSLFSCGLYNSFSGDKAILNSDNPAVASVLLRNNCYSCHGGWSEYATNREWQFAQLQLFDVGYPTSSEMYMRMNGSGTGARMPPSPFDEVNATDLAVINDWISTMTLELPDNWNESDIFEAAFIVLQTKCIGCHSEGGTGGGPLNFMTASLKQKQSKGTFPTEAEVRATILASDPDMLDSQATTNLISVMNLPTTSTNYMPRGKTITAEEKLAIETWFNVIKTN